ncbi:MAG: D-hexose-6-phosphate mutarotase [Victivallaceae bacterium]|nr:D-hexose-6-phosphate mutarotase [Victivallaceae bacterium]
MNNNITELNNRFSVDGIKFITGTGEMPVIEIANRFAAAKVALHGAHVMSYTPVGEDDLLWMSRSSWFEPNKPIRGGIPICWPWFGGHPTDSNLPSHGFARISEWQLESIELAAAGAHIIVLGLSDSKITRKMWNFAFKAELTVTVGAELRVELMMRNCDAQPFETGAALHNYFAVNDISQVKVSGLAGCAYLDTVDHNHKVQDGDICFPAETDNVYLDTAAEVIIHDNAQQRKISIAKNGSNSTVVWNPWCAKAARMPDFGDNEYTQMLCVETTNAESDTRTIHSGAEHRLETIISLV